jgi:hypothetical protein
MNKDVLYDEKDDADKNDDVSIFLKPMQMSNQNGF